MNGFIFSVRRRRPAARRTATPAPKLPLVLVSRDKSSAHYRTKDGRYDVLGHDLDTRGSAAAGAVWSWRPAKATSAWSDDMRHFASKTAMLISLDAEMKQP